MCMMCDGASPEEVDQWMEATIARAGWAVTGVEDDHVVDWAYTVGLVDGFNHPELIVVGMGPGALRTLDEIGERVRAGERFGPMSVVEIGEHLFPFGPVDPGQFDTEVFNGWTSYYGNHMREYVPPVALQVFPPRCLVERGGDPARWSLDTPAEVLGVAQPRNLRQP